MGLSAAQHKMIKNLCSSFERVQLLYFFGSRRRGDGDSRSDYDFAVLFSRTKAGLTATQLKLYSGLMEATKSDHVDLVVLNSCTNLILKYNILSQGDLLFERPKMRIDYEVATLNEYFDFRILERQYYVD